ncbi:MAG TPA: cell division protein FtsA [bacterium]|jgi:cell division protein FtsA|nr:cell division protein FtsA [bacterium]HOQ91660.1 cell division protein FtsA [bacterium]HPL22062.1 cell division protein FtsA [bacterium]HPW44229.1 cell division protein FtsA [bacterium]
MRDQTLVAGLDIGSTEIRLVVGQTTGGQLQIIGAVSAPAAGISKGIVNNIEEVASSVMACLEKSERLIGVRVDSVYIGVSAPSLKCERSKGVVAINQMNNEITDDDVTRVIEAAQALSLPANYEVLHVIPIKYRVDNQDDVKNPVGMSGIRLEVEVLIIQSLTNQIRNMTKAIEQAGLSIVSPVLAPLAAAEAVVSARSKELGVALVNIGSLTTSLAVFEEGQLLHAAILPIGSDHITADIAIGLRCSINLAEKIKLEFGQANPEKIDKDDEVDITPLISPDNEVDEPMTVSMKYLSGIIEARVSEIFHKVDVELKKINRSGMLPAGVVLLGGGAKLAGLTDLAKKNLRLPVCLGANRNITAVIDKVNDLSYLTALGLVAWGDHYDFLTDNDSVSSGFKPKQVIKRAKDWFGSLFLK